MAIRDKFRDSVQPLLQPGEEIQAVFGAQSHSAWLMVVTGIFPFLFFNKYYVIAATDRRIVIARSGAFQVAKAREIVAEAPARPGSGRLRGSGTRRRRSACGPTSTSGSTVM